MTRTNIIRESDEILGDRNQVRARSSSKSSSSDDPIFKDFRKGMKTAAKRNGDNDKGDKNIVK